MPVSARHHSRIHCEQDEPALSAGFRTGVGIGMLQTLATFSRMSLARSFVATVPRCRATISRDLSQAELPCGKSCYCTPR
jgi:hypothetical protein